MSRQSGAAPPPDGSKQESASIIMFQELAKLKVDVLKLDERSLDITGTYSVSPIRISGVVGGVPSASSGLPSRLSVGLESFGLPTQGFGTLARECRVLGLLKNLNTIEAFKTFDRRAWLQSLGSQIWDDIMSGAAVRDPSKLARFSVLCYADLKTNKFIYWFAFPALVSNPPFRAVNSAVPLWSGASSGGCFLEAECLMLLEAFWEFRRLRMEQTHDAHSPPFFLVIRSVNTTPTASGGTSSSLSLEVAPLEAYESLSDDVKCGVLFGVVDPGTEKLVPGWPLRNLLMLLANKWNLKQARILCFRGRVMKFEGSATEGMGPAQAAEAVGDSFIVEAAMAPTTNNDSGACPEVVGWESNKFGKSAPQQTDLSSMMDPVRLAESSVDLNLKLMRWRLLPALNVPMLARTKCLLIGAGTLGCGVARCLLGWGVRTITLVDNGRVSLSNPVRQSLFEFADCANGGKPKAPAAAEALRRIFPGVNAEGHVMTIPMPGHPIHTPGEMEIAQRDTAKLDELVRGHDVVFLLTDTRESRWLPTVMAGAYDKTLVNAALGFDTFMIMRHGGGIRPEEPQASPDRLGCYFCNDVVGPEDSTKDRTLDQQCTVTRPGLAQVASALAVELMVALLHHPRRHHAPADAPTDEAASMVNLGRLDDPDRPLGILPQQIRGFLSHFTTILPVTMAFDCCTGCAKSVLDQYRSIGFELVINAANNPGGSNYLEELTGLAALRRKAEGVEDMLLAWDDDDESEQTSSADAHVECPLSMKGDDADDIEDEDEDGVGSDRVVLTGDSQRAAAPTIQRATADPSRSAGAGHDPVSRGTATGDGVGEGKGAAATCSVGGEGNGGMHPLAMSLSEIRIETSPHECTSPSHDAQAAPAATEAKQGGAGRE